MSRCYSCLKAKFHYTSWFGASSELASVMEFGFYTVLFCSAFGKVMGKSCLTKAPCAPATVLLKDKKTRLRSDVWRAGTVVTASRYD